MRNPPSTDRGRGTVRRILDAACELFAHQGIRATTLDQVGRLSGTGRSQLYHFFADKNDLVAEVAASQVRRVLDAQQPLLGTFSTAAELRALCDAAIDQYATNAVPTRCPIGSLVHELDDQNTAARAALTAGFAEWRRQLACGLTRINAAGLLATGIEPDTAAAALIAAYEGGVLISGATGNLEPLRTSLHTLLSLTLPNQAS